MALFSVVIFSRCRNLLLSNRANNIFLSCAHFLSNTGSHDLRIVNVAKRLPLFLAAEGNFGRTAIFDRLGQFMYDDVFHLSTCLSKDLLELHGVSKDRTLDQARVGYVCENDVSFLVTTFAVWMCNGICVPLCKTHPIKELEYFVRDSGCSLLVSSAGFADKMNSLAQQVCVPLRVIGDSEMTGSYSVNQWLVSDSATSDRRRGKARKARPKRWFDLALFNNDFKTKPAMLIYTSGTTGRPKGVMLTHGNLSAMMSNMADEWKWRPGDVILHVLPLHHVHGIVNALFTSLVVGASCWMLPSFSPEQVWNCLIQPASQLEGRHVTIFMAVPTIFSKLIQYFDQRFSCHGRSGSRLSCDYIKSVCSSRIRLMVSGSAALPSTVMSRWFEITGHHLLERYGATETGMMLTNPLSGPRVPGTVGKPFPSVEVCISRPNVYAKYGYDVLASATAQRINITKGEEEQSGELLVRGPSVFQQYWQRPEATANCFTTDGWFKTGDTASVNQDGVFKILGRNSTDIIKSGGYKISAIDVEEHLLCHPDIVECAVVGVPDITWGQRVAAVVVLKGDGGGGEGLSSGLSRDSLRLWAEDVMPAYQIPSVVRCVAELPRNTMGKVNKVELMSSVFQDVSKAP